MNLDDNLRFGFLIHDVSRLRRVVVDRALKPLGITRSQWWVIAYLSRRDGMTQTALAADLDLTKMAVGGLLKRLEEGGFVERRADASDARARRIYLTRSGERLMRTIRENVDAVEQALLVGVNPRDLQVTAHVLRQMKATLLNIIQADDDTLAN